MQRFRQRYLPRTRGAALGLAALLAVTGGTADSRQLITGINRAVQADIQACLDYYHSDAEIARICTRALQAQQIATPGQIARMRDSLGYAHRALGAADKARALYHQIVDDGTNGRLGHLGLGWMAIDSDPALAAQHFAKANLIWVTADATAALARARFQAEDIGFDAFMDGLDAALALNPEYSWAWREKGWWLFEYGYDAQAADAYGAVLAYDPEDADAWYGRAQALQGSAPLAALDAAYRVLDLDPADQWGHDLAVALLLDLDRAPQALDQARAYLWHHPDLNDAHVMVARALRATGQGAKAAAQLAPRVDGSDDGYLRYWYADILITQGHFAPAETVLRGSLDFAQNVDASDHQLLGLALARQGDWQAAAEQVAIGLDMDWEFADLHYLNAEIALHWQDLDAALVAIDTALDQDPNPDWIAILADRLDAMDHGDHAADLRRRLAP